MPIGQVPVRVEERLQHRLRAEQRRTLLRTFAVEVFRKALARYQDVRRGNVGLSAVTVLLPQGSLQLLFVRRFLWLFERLETFHAEGIRRKGEVDGHRRWLVLFVDVVDVRSQFVFGSLPDATVRTYLILDAFVAIEVHVQGVDCRELPRTVAADVWLFIGNVRVAMSLERLLGRVRVGTYLANECGQLRFDVVRIVDF